MNPAPSAPDVCLVSTQHPARNPRVVKEADALSSAGFSVLVLTIAAHRPSLSLDQAIVARHPWRLRYAINLTQPAGGGALYAATLRLRVRIARELQRRWRIESPDSLGAVRGLLRAAARTRARLFIGHTEGGLWVVSKLLDEGRRVGADFEDWHSEDLLPENRASLPLGLLRRIEGRLLAGAAYTSTTSEALAGALHARYGGPRPVVLTNSFPLQTDPRRGPPGSPPGFVWFSQTVGAGRGLEAFVDAWSRMREPSRLALVGESAGDFAHRLRAIVPENRRERMQFVPSVPNDRLPGLIAQYDIGLALEESTIPSRDLTITNKILQYLNAGLAVLATPTSGQCEVFSRDPSIGAMIDRHRPALAQCLDAFVADRVLLSHRQQAARELAASHYSWEREAPRLIEQVKTTLGRPALATSAK